MEVSKDLKWIFRNAEQSFPFVRIRKCFDRRRHRERPEPSAERFRDSDRRGGAGATRRDLHEIGTALLGDPPLGGFERFEMENRTFCFQTAGGSRDAYPPMGPREPSAKPFSLSDKRTNTKTFLIATFMKSELHFWGPPPWRFRKI